MADKGKLEVVDVTAGNVDKEGFFCCMSKKKSEGYQRKLAWLKDRFAEGMRLKIIKEGGRGFIEYIPGEYAWRPVDAKGYMFIHCLWVIGKSKGKGCGTFLLNECIEDAKRSGMKGVATVTGKGTGLVSKRFYVRNGFECVDKAPPSFELMVKSFGQSKPPSFANGWGAKLKQCGKGLTLVRTDQCPYLVEATEIVLDAAEEAGIEGQVVELDSCRSVRELSPSAYGTFNVVHDGKLLSHFCMTKKSLLGILGVGKKQ